MALLRSRNPGCWAYLRELAAGLLCRLIRALGAAAELSRRLCDIFLRDKAGKRATLGDNQYFQNDPYWRDHIPFYEYFHGDTGAGVGASHQTGWTALVAKLLEQTRGR